MVTAASRRTMDIRAHTSVVFHLDKCIGCHTCSIACKNTWTDRPGAEYMWWNNVETKPGTGYPTRWEDQQHYRGGWEIGARRRLALRAQGRLGGLLRLFYNPAQPGLDDYYEPWTYRFSDLLDAPEGDDPPTARPISMITGEPIDIEAGPNWDDDLSGSPLYARSDPNLEQLPADLRDAMFAVERLAMMYLPRICNHCANPPCVASCPSGALYKRGEDGVVLIHQHVCRGWRNCVAACPYKKTYFNWKTGKSEKCILCYPRVETGQAPACFHSCVGRIRFVGVMLIDAARLEEAASVPAEALVEAQRDILLDPRDPEIARAALECGVPPQMVDAARRSPVLRLVKEWGLALPLHPEFRTLPMLFYVPPLLPVLGQAVDEVYRHEPGDGPFAAFDRARVPLAFLARLFAAGNPAPVAASLRRQLAVRLHRRAREVGDVTDKRAARALRDAGLDGRAADRIHRLTALSTLAERYVLPPIQREEAMPDDEPAGERRGSVGLGRTVPPRRRG